MFHLLDLNARLLPELKEIARKFDVKADGLKKQDLIVHIIEAQLAKPDLAAKIKKEHPEAGAPETEVKHAKRPRKVKLEPLNEEVTKSKIETQHHEEPVIQVHETKETPVKEDTPANEDNQVSNEQSGNVRNTNEQTANEEQNDRLNKTDFRNKHQHKHQREDFQYNFDGI